MSRALSLLLLLPLAAAGCAKKNAAEATTKSVTAPAGLEEIEIVPNPMIPPQVYTDGIGIVVELVPLKAPPGEEAQALLRVSGLQSFISGVTFLVKRSRPPTPDAWTVPIDGDLSYVLQTLRDRDGNISTKLVVPRGHGAGLPLTLRPEASALVQIDELIADYKSHLRDGSLERIAKYDRGYAQGLVEKRIAEGREQIREFCGKEIEVEMDWERLQAPEQFTHAAFCGTALRTLAQICQSGPADKEQIRNKVDRLYCRYDDKLSLRYEQDEKTWHVSATGKLLSLGKAGDEQASRSLGLRRTVIKSQNGVYATLPTRHEDNRSVYVGSAKKLYRQSGKRATAHSNFSVWGPTRDISVRVKEKGVWEAQCDGGPIIFRVVGAAEREKVLTGASMEEPIWQREELILGRDDRGIYYFVDRKLREFGGLDYRVYKGPRGRLRLTTMVDIVDDAQGQIFSTTTGALRLMFSDGEPKNAKWIRGKRQQDLVLLNSIATRKLVFGDLGIYEGQETGTLCSLAEAGTAVP